MSQVYTVLRIRFATHLLYGRGLDVDFPGPSYISVVVILQCRPEEPRSPPLFVLNTLCKFLEFGVINWFCVRDINMSSRHLDDRIGMFTALRGTSSSHCELVNWGCVARGLASQHGNNTRYIRTDRS